MTRYMMFARSQGKLYAQRRFQSGRDTHRWVFVDGLTPEVEYTVRHWLTVRLNGFYCDLQAMYTPHLRLHTHSAAQARTHIVLLGAPPLHAMAEGDETAVVDARGLSARDVAKASIEATKLNPHMMVCGWPFCLDDLRDANAGGGEQ